MSLEAVKFSPIRESLTGAPPWPPTILSCAEQQDTGALKTMKKIDPKADHADVRARMRKQVLADADPWKDDLVGRFLRALADPIGDR